MREMETQKIPEDMDKFKPKISPNIRFKFLKEDERGRFYIVEKTRKEGKPVYLKIHEAGKEAISLMNGKLTLSQIDVKLKEKDIEIDLNEFVKLLGCKGFIQNYPYASKIKTGEKTKLRVRYFPIIKNPEKFVAKVYGSVKYFFTRKILIFFILFNMAILLFFILLFSFGKTNLDGIFTLYGSSFVAFFLYMLVFFPLIIFLHELAHAITCFHYGGKIGEIGVSLYLFAPFFYADTSGTWMLSKKQSIMVFLAGPLFTIFIGNLSFLLQFYVTPPFNKILLMITFASYFSAIFGLNPLMETDGYYVLQTLADFPNLHSNAWEYVVLWLKCKIRKITKDEYREYMSCYSRNEKRILSLYTPFVVLVNGLFLLIMTLWIPLLFREYVNLTLEVTKGLISIDAFFLILWGFETFYFSLIAFIFLRMIIRGIKSRINTKNY